MNKKISSLKDILNQPTQQIMDLTFQCVCGKSHSIPIKKLVIGTDITKNIRSELESLNINGIAGVIYDRRIESTVVNPVINNLKESGIEIIEYTFEKNKGYVLPEIKNSKSAAEFFKDKVNYLISIGSGVISDITKYAGDILNIPVVLIATAPSMNGYTSILGAMTDDGIKKTLPVKTLTAVFADINILKKSPIDMVLSGFGDILSKATSIADWKLSELVKKTYFCPTTFHITDITEKEYMAIPEEIGKRTEKGIKVLTDGIMRSGLSMTIVEKSTPSSGSEHVISHYWDLLALINKREKRFHGTQVGVATPIASRLFDFLSDYPVKKMLKVEKLKDYYMDKDTLKDFLLKRYKTFGNGLYEQVSKKHLEWKDKKKEIEYIIDNWYQIWDSVFEYVKPADRVEDVLKRSGAPLHYRDIGLSRDDAADAIINGWVLRPRYNILDTLHDLGLSTRAAEKVLD